MLDRATGGRGKLLSRSFSVRQLISLVAILCQIPLFCVGFIQGSVDVTLLCIVLTWICLFIMFLARKDATKLAFVITFFFFLLGELFLNQFDTTAFHASNTETVLHTHLCIYIALLAFLLGTFLVGDDNNNSELRGSVNGQDDLLLGVRNVSKAVFYLCAICSFLLALERLNLAHTLGSYTETFVNFSSNLPGFVSKLGGMANFALFIYLGTLPDPRKSKMVFGIQMAIAIVMLMYGTRNTLVMTFLLLGVYCILYERKNGIDFQIIPRWVYALLPVAIPVALVFFDIIMALRDGRAYSSEGFFDSITHIVASLGGSVNVISYGFECADQLPNRLYSFGGLIDFFTQNVFAQTVLGTQQFGGNTVELALYGNSFSSALTYIVKPASYLSGYGMGSSYIAEAYHDFGYLGVAIFSTLYGMILQGCGRLKEGKVIRNTVVLMASYYIWFAPRSYADGFISCFMNFSFILTVVIILFGARIYLTKARRSKVVLA